jgi:hypothetical protein
MCYLNETILTNNTFIVASQEGRKRIAFQTDKIRNVTANEKNKTRSS